MSKETLLVIEKGGKLVMVFNDIENDIKKMMIDCKWKQRDLADAVGVTEGCISRLLHKKSERCFDQIFLDAVEQLGFDIKLEYIPREVK